VQETWLVLPVAGAGIRVIIEDPASNQKPPTPASISREINT
jgi:hypothetical protein